MRPEALILEEKRIGITREDRQIFSSVSRFSSRVNSAFGFCMQVVEFDHRLASL